MSDYLVASPADGGWHMELDELERLVRARWPQAEITRLDAGAGETLDFEVEAGEPPERLLCSLLPGGTTLVIRGDLPGSAAVAAWYREQLPSGQEFAFFDEEYSFHVALDPGITASAVEQRTAEQWRS